MAKATVALGRPGSPTSSRIGWASEQQVRSRYLSAHHLRPPATHRLAAWALPACAWRHLWHQLYQPAQGPHLTLKALVPITPCMRLDNGGPEQITAYLHPPARYLTGPWHALPTERVRAGYQGLWVEVVVE